MNASRFQWFAPLLLAGALVCLQAENLAGQQFDNRDSKSGLKTPSSQFALPDGSIVDTPQRTEEPVTLGDRKRICIELIDGSRILTDALDTDSLKMDSTIGPITVPLERAAEIRLQRDGLDPAQNARQRVSILFHNGDRLSGNVETRGLKVKTDWGSAEIDTAQVAVIRIVQVARHVETVEGAKIGGRHLKRHVVRTSLREIEPVETIELPDPRGYLEPELLPPGASPVVEAPVVPPQTRLARPVVPGPIRE